MKKEQHLPSTTLSEQSKGNKNFDSSHFESQLETIKSYFKVMSASRFMCLVDTGIPIQNVCRLVWMLFEEDDIAVQKKDYCGISGQLVQHLTCNRALFPKRPKQLELFQEGGCNV